MTDPDAAQPAAGYRVAPIPADIADLPFSASGAGGHLTRLWT